MDARLGGVMKINKDDFTFTFRPVENSLTIKKTPDGYEARYLAYDNEPIAPNDDPNDKIFLVGYHRDFFVTSKHITEDQCRNLLIVPEFLSKEDLKFVKKWNKKYHGFKLEAYIHSGVALALSQEGNFPDRRWDVSQLGLVFVSKSEWADHDKAKEAARNLIESWNCYLSGDVYGCVVETYDKDKELVDYDSCWNFYRFKDALKELKTFR
jgi:hypothetical protein